MDDDVREAERRWKQSGTADDAKDLLVQVERSGGMRVTRAMIETIVRSQRVCEYLGRGYEVTEVSALMGRPVSDVEVLALLGIFREPPIMLLVNNGQVNLIEGVADGSSQVRVSIVARYKPGEEFRIDMDGMVNIDCAEGALDDRGIAIVTFGPTFMPFSCSGKVTVGSESFAFDVTFEGSQPGERRRGRGRGRSP